MKAKITFYTIVPVVLIALPAVFVMTGCKDQESMAIAENNSHEAPAIPVSVISRGTGFHAGCRFSAG